MVTKIKMERIRDGTDPHPGDPTKDPTSFIELNVDMNVTVSNVKKSKIFQRSRSVVLFLLAIAFAVVLSHMRKEVRTLQVQMQSVNMNLLVLMSKYDRLNRSLNRAWFHRRDRSPEHRSMDELRRLLEDASSITETTIEMFDGIRNETRETSHALNAHSQYFNSVGSSENERSSQADAHSASARSELSSTRSSSLAASEDDGKPDDNDQTNLRIERAILTASKGISSEKQIDSNPGDTVVYNNDTDSDYYVDDDLESRREPRARRSRRDEGRGKKRGKNKRRPKRRRLGPLVATFVGAIPEQHITDSVYIGPWVKSTKNNTQFSLNKFHLVEDKKSIEVTTTGLYMISAQIFYFGEPTNYSYWILLSSEGDSKTQKLVKCSTASSTSATEVSCYTSVITLLQRGDRVHIQQQEKNRFINMREGHSYIQLVLLSNNIHKNRQR